jgi:MFS family permease
MTNQLNPKPERVMDRIINNYGYGPITWKNFFIVFMMISLEGFHVTFFGNVIIPLKNYYQMSEEVMQVISSIFFLALACGSFLTGHLSEKFKRRNIILICQFNIALSHVLMAFNTNTVLFAILRLSIGFNCGIIGPLSINMLAEYLPINCRSVMLTGCWIGIAPGQLVILVIMMYVMPNMEVAQFSKTILISSVWSISVFFICLLLMKDSPRNLIVNDQYEEAYETLAKFKGDELTQEEKQELVKEVKYGGANKNLNVTMKDLFNEGLFLTTVLSIFIWVINSILNYGPLLISTLTMKELGQEEDLITNREIIMQQIIIVLLMTPANLIGGLVSEIEIFGRKNTIIISFFFAIIFNFLMIYNSSNYHYHFGIYMLFIDLSYDVNTTYCCEIYPTKVRDLALGYLFFWNRVGGFISQILFIYFYKIGLWVPYWATIALTAVNIMLVFYLPIETHSRPLDQEDECVHYSTFEDVGNAKERRSYGKLS